MTVNGRKAERKREKERPLLVRKTSLSSFVIAARSTDDLEYVAC